jgi:hypothetical protein
MGEHSTINPVIVVEIRRTHRIRPDLSYAKLGRPFGLSSRTVQRICEQPDAAIALARAVTP